jgi:hypothetical protein
MSERGGVAIYVKSEFNSSEILWIAKHFQLLAVKVNMYKDPCITIVGCYIPPSASGEALNSLSDVLHKLNDLEFIIF